MAQSPSHLFGQIIGEMFERTFHEYIDSFCIDRGLFLDKVGIRPARKGKKVRWKDKYGSEHDLDYVIEKDGTPEKIGVPIAFIESAWRRYTKHSKNKAQEIQGAILPLAETYKNYHPFLGAILSGEFTSNAIQQLEAIGFTVLYIPYNTILEAFKTIEFDASWVEETPDEIVQKKVNAWNGLTNDKIQQVKDAIINLCEDDINKFFTKLEDAINRMIQRIIIIPLYGNVYNLSDIGEAIAFINNYESEVKLEFQKFEVEIRYNNGDSIKASFSTTVRLREFLEMYQ